MTNAGPPLPLVSAPWLLANLSTVIPVDTRWYLDGRVGLEAFRAGHIPGAVHLDVDRHLSSPRGAGRPGRHPLPDPQRFSSDLASAGISPGSTLVLYDDEGGAIAARLWWLLRYLRHPARALLLDGGIQAWQAANGPLSQGDSTRPPVQDFPVLSPDSSLVLDREQVRQRSEACVGVLLDARALPRYRGDVEPIDPRAGHIPGARSAPFSGNLREPKGVFLDPDELRQRYEQLGVSEGSDVVVYCGSGVTACHALLALELIGVRGRLYEGSWSDWSSDPGLPARTGDDP
jgi:thiosulfate/3-mercaptopyruvate sulfurtransferase